MPSKRKKPGPKEERRIRLLCGALERLMPPEQAEKAARSLWRTWGSLGGIAGAPEEALAAEPGMDADTAGHLRLTLELARACLEERAEDIKRVADRQSAVELFLPMFLGRRSEAVGVILLDSGRRAIYSGIVCEGSVSAVPLYVRKLVRLCIDCDADSLLLAHNHISGRAAPSKQDVLTTKQLELALGCIQVKLSDHIILTDSDQFSFFESGLLRTMSGESLAERRTELSGTLDLVDELEKTGLAGIN